MIEFLPSPAYVSAFRITGTLDGDEYDRCIADVEKRLSQFDRIGVFCDMIGFTGLTPQALAKDLRYALGKFGEYGRFARCALITDKHWLGQVYEFAGHLLPRTEIRAFDASEHEAAMAWASDVATQGL